MPAVGVGFAALLEHRGEEREDQLSGLIEASGMSLRERIQELAQVKGKRRLLSTSD
jgi:hypothetical protein